MPRKLFVEGHRGAISHNSENTIEAFLEADRLEIDGIEFDLWLLADGKPVVAHGKSANGLEVVWNTQTLQMECIFLPLITSAQLRTYRHPDKTSMYPLWEEVLTKLSNSKLYLNAEIKDTRETLVRAVLETVARIQPKCKFHFSSFSHEVRPLIDKHSTELGLPAYAFGFLAHEPNGLPKEVDGQLQGLRPGDTINVDITLVLADNQQVKAYIQKAKQAGYHIKVYNLMLLTEFETPALYEKFIEWGIDTFICNHVERLIEFNKLQNQS